MKIIVISIGGSVIISEDIDIKYYKKLSELLNKLIKNYKLFLIIGGGNIARKYIKLGRELKLDEKTLDDFGIRITNLIDAADRIKGLS